MSPQSEFSAHNTGAWLVGWIVRKYDAVTGLGRDGADVLVDVLIQVAETLWEDPVCLVRPGDACCQTKLEVQSHRMWAALS